MFSCQSDEDEEAAAAAEAEAELPPEEEVSNNDQYWQRVLGEEYSLHMAQLQQQQEELARSLGKGKRVRKQINYAEQAMMEVANANAKDAKVRLRLLLLKVVKQCMYKWWFMAVINTCMLTTYGGSDWC